MPAPQRRAAFPTEPHLVDPSGTVAVWFTDPPGAVTQFSVAARGTVPLAQWLVGAALRQLLSRFPGDGKLVLVMDLGLMTDCDPKVRPLIVEAAKANRARIAKSTIVAPLHASAIYLASLHASVSLLRVFGVPVELHSLDVAIGPLRAARR